MCWYNDDPLRWQVEQQIAAVTLIDVEAGIDGNDHAYFRGNLEVSSEHGHVYETVRLRFVYPSTFPARNQPPSVYLESHRDRWKNGGNSHIEHNWKLCLFVPAESGIDFADENSLRKLIGVVHTFLLKERIYQRRLSLAELQGGIAEWPGPDRSHGIEGIREAIRDMGGVGRNSPCPCGSGLKFKQCCIHKL